MEKDNFKTSNMPEIIKLIKKEKYNSGEKHG